MADTSVRDMTLYDARIMPKDLLTIVVSCPEEPALAEPFNLTIATPVSNTGSQSLTSQPALQQYLVDNNGNVEFPVLGTIHLGGLTKGEAEQYIKDKLKSQFRETPIVTVRMINIKYPSLAKSVVRELSPFPTKRSISSKPLPWQAI